MKNLYLIFVIALFSLSTLSSYSQTWIQIGEDIVGEANGDNFGNSMDLSADGNIIAIGGWNNDGNGVDAGHLRIYENYNGVWTQIGDDIDGNAGEKKGFSVSLNDSGNIVALSTPYVNSNTGKVSIYKNVNGVWTQMGDDIFGKGEYYFSGVSIDLSPDGNMIAISNHANYGFVRLYEYKNDAWTLAEEISGSLYNEQLGARGLQFNKDGSILAAGTSTYSMVRVFKKQTDNNWVQLGDSIPNNHSVFSLSSDSLTVAVGDGSWFGKVQVYRYNNGAWIQQGNDLGGWFTGTGYAKTVELNSDGTMLLVTAAGDNGATGKVRTYDYINGEWIHRIEDITGVDRGDFFGTKLCLNSNDSILAVSSPRNTGDMGGPGSVRIFRHQKFLPISVDTSIAICDNQLPYTFGTQSLTSEGSYVEVFESKNGVDSTVTLSLIVHISPYPVVSNEADTLTSDNSFSSYQWYDQDGIIAGATSKHYVIDNSGTYFLKVTNEHGCSAMSSGIKLIKTGLNDINKEKLKLTIFPNPNDGIFILKFENEKSGRYQIQLINKLGQVQLEKEIYLTSNVHEEEFNLKQMAKGNYFVKVFNGAISNTQKIILK